MTWKYAWNVALWAKRLTSLAAAFALSGAPALLLACMVLCQKALPAAAAPRQQSGPASHAAHSSAPAPAPAVASDHAHHGPPDSPAARLIATCDHGCPGRVAFVAARGLEPTNAHAFSAAPMASSVASFLVTTSGGGGVPHSPPVPPRFLTRVPFVLRI